MVSSVIDCRTADGTSVMILKTLAPRPGGGFLDFSFAMVPPDGALGRPAPGTLSDDYLREAALRVLAAD